MEDANNREKIVRTFYAYCKRVLLNARTDVYRDRFRMSERERLFCDMTNRDIDRLSTSCEFETMPTVFNARGNLIEVSDEELADALEALEEEDRAIILLSYFAEWSDMRIAIEFGRPRSTVQYRRSRALTALRAHLQEGGCIDWI